MKKIIIMVVVLFLLAISLPPVFALNVTEGHDKPLDNSATTGDDRGIRIRMHEDRLLQAVERSSSSQCHTLRVWELDTYTQVTSAPFNTSASGRNATFNGNVTLLAGHHYGFGCHGSGNWLQHFSANDDNVNKTYIEFYGGFQGSAPPFNNGSRYHVITRITTSEVGEAPPSFTPYINITNPFNLTYYNSPSTTFANITFSLNYEANNCSLYGNKTGVKYTIEDYQEAGFSNETSYYNATVYEINTNNTIGIYRFEEGSGNNATDLSGNDYHGVIYGATYTTSKGDRNTSVGALDFDGINDQLNITDSDVWSFTDGASNDKPFTFSVWANLDDATRARFINKQSGAVTTNPHEYAFATSAGDALLLILKQGTNDIRIGRISTVSLTADEGTWVHLVATYDGRGGGSADDGIALYRNGVATGSVSTGAGSYVGMQNTGENVQIGTDGTAYRLNGRLDEVLVFNYSLTPSEVEALYIEGINQSRDTVLENVTLIEETIDTNDYFIYNFGVDTQEELEFIVNCQNSTTDTNSSPINFGYNSDFTAPIITLLYPSADLGINTTIEVNVSTNEVADCDFNNSFFTQVYTNGTFHQWQETLLENGNYSIYLNCSDGVGNQDYINVTFLKDTILPGITYNNPSEANNTVFFQNVSNALDIFIFDANLFGYEVLVYNQVGTLIHNFTELNLEVQTITVEESIFPTTLGNWTIHTTAWDSHTAKQIKDKEHKIIDNTILFELDKKDKGKRIREKTNLSITYSGNIPLEALNTVKKKDRYNFAYQFYYDSNHKFAEKVRHKFTLQASDLYFIQQSEYPAHFVDFASATWIDFNTKDLKDWYIEACGEDCYTITVDVKPDKDGILEFMSIGDLNTNTKEVMFIVDEDTRPRGLISDVISSFECPNDSLADVMVLWLIFFILVGLVIVNEVIIKRGIFGIIVGVGILLFSFVIMGCNNILGFILSALAFIMIVFEGLR